MTSDYCTRLADACPLPREVDPRVVVHHHGPDGVPSLHATLAEGPHVAIAIRGLVVEVWDLFNEEGARMPDVEVAGPGLHDGAEVWMSTGSACPSGGPAVHPVGREGLTRQPASCEVRVLRRNIAQPAMNHAMPMPLQERAVVGEEVANLVPEVVQQEPLRCLLLLRAAQNSGRDAHGLEV